MRLLRLDFGDDLYSIDLHPLVSVVSGLSAPHQLQLFRSVRQLASGSAMGVRGLLQHEGLLMDLDGTTADPLGGGESTVDPIIYVDGGADAALLIGLQAEIDQWERQADIDSVTVEEVRADVDPSVKARVASLRRMANPHDVSDEGPGGRSAQRLRYASVRRAYDTASTVERKVVVANPALTALVERWQAYLIEHAQSAERLEKMSVEVAEANDHLHDARRRLEQAELDAAPAMLTTDEERRLEELSDLEAAGKGLFRKSLSSEEKAEAQALLDKVGVDSWTEYSVYRLAPTVSDDRQRGVDRAEAEIEQAEEALDRAREGAAADRVAVTLNEELAEIKEAARPYLGALVPTDVGSALTDQIEWTDNPDWLAAFNDLRDVLANNDLRPPYGYEPEEILAWSESWLRTEESLQPNDDRGADNGVTAMDPDELGRELQEAERQLLRHRRALARIERAEQAADHSQSRLAALRHQLAERSASRTPGTAEEILRSVRPLVARIGEELDSTLPLVVAGAMSDLDRSEIEDLMAGLEAMSEQVQIILATSRPEAAGWANEVGLKRAGLSSGAKAVL